MTSSTCARATVDRTNSLAHRALSALVFVLTLAFVAPAAAARLQGRVKHGVYHSPAKNFTVPVPKGMGMRVSDGFRNEDGFPTGAVSFHDDWGNLFAIHYAGLPPEAVARFAEPGSTEILLGSWLSMFAMPVWFLNASPESRVLHQTFGSFEGLEVLVAQVEIPGASTLAVHDSSGVRRMDSVRGLVIFRQGPYIYMLATETKGGLQQILAPESAQQAEIVPDSDEAWMRFIDTFKPFYQSIEFE